MRIPAFLVLFLFPLVILGQGTSGTSNLPVILPLSPEAAELGRYGEMPVGEYTGTPDIGLPLYKIEAGALSVPISLNYLPTGIRVNQEATWVGLGWSLNAGGAISYIPVGGNDQLPPFNNASQAQWDNLFSWHNYPFKEHEHNPSGGQPLQDNSRTPSVLVLNLQNGRGEPDEYSVNFAGHSFKFLLHPKTGEVYFVGQKSKCKIVKNSGQSWSITDENGVRYDFTATETSGYADVSYLSWYLTAIQDRQGNLIRLRYRNFGITQLIPEISEDYVSNAFLSEIRLNPAMYPSFSCIASSPGKMAGDRQLYTDVNYKIRNLYLSEIESDYEIVRFVPSARQDIVGDSRKLDSIIVVSKLTNEPIKQFSFKYTYFNGLGAGGDYLAENDAWQTFYGATYPLGFRQKRLKLDSLIVSGKNGVRGEKYSFRYNELHSLPGKTSFARDFWGFYNGQENYSILSGGQHTTVPSSISLFLHDLPKYNGLPGSIATVRGANRYASKEYITTGMLTQIIYPTGGHTDFEYEPHSFNNNRIKIPSVETEAVIMPQKVFTSMDYNNPPNQTASQTFTLKTAAYVYLSGYISGRGLNTNYTGAQIGSAYVRILGTAPDGSPLNKNYNVSPSEYATFDQTYLKQWNDVIFLTPGSYGLIAYFPDALGYQNSGTAATSVTVSYKDINTDSVTTMESFGGGVRIKSITSYADDNTIATRKEFNYRTDSGQSSGKLMSRLTNYTEDKITTGANPDPGWFIPGDPAGAPDYGVYCLKQYQQYRLASGSSGPLMSTPNGNHVGYDQVNVYSVGNNKNNGKTTSYFVNIPATQYFDDLSLFDGLLENGSLTRKILLNTQGDTVKVSGYRYDNLLFNREQFSARIKRIYEGSDNFTPAWGYFYERYWFTCYPTISKYNVLTWEEDITYDLNNRLRTTKEYKYDTANFQLTEVKELMSDGRYKLIRNRYPEDFKSEMIYSELVNANIIAPLIDQQELLLNADNSTLKISQRKNDFQWYNNARMILPGLLSISQGNNPLEVRAETYSYDLKGNITEQGRANDIHYSYIWDYKQKYPVAEVSNALYSRIAYTSFESDGTGNWTLNGSVINNDGVTGKKCFTGSLSCTLPEAGSYIVTAWCDAAGNASVNGAAGVTKGTRGNWKLLEWKLTGVLNVVVQGTKLDEVRLYPTEASMQTRTYEPLIGVSTECDGNNRITQYQYDEQGRLICIRDHEGNVIKKFEYQLNQ